MEGNAKEVQVDGDLACGYINKVSGDGSCLC